MTTLNDREITNENSSHLNAGGWTIRCWLCRVDLVRGSAVVLYDECDCCAEDLSVCRRLDSVRSLANALRIAA